jgi:chemotaxis protein MotB
VFFALASSRMRDPMRNALDIIGQELSRLHNAVIIEGHTDAAQFAGVYTNWELSSDRANAARRVLEAAGLHPNRIVEVRGHADRQLRNPENPLDPRNRRITIVLPFLTAEPDQPTIVVPAG